MGEAGAGAETNGAFGAPPCCLGLAQHGQGERGMGEHPGVVRIMRQGPLNVILDAAHIGRIVRDEIVINDGRRAGEQGVGKAEVRSDL